MSGKRLGRGGRHLIRPWGAECARARQIAQLAAQNIAVVAQDIEVLEAIEALFQSGAELPDEISMKSDLGAMRARLRIIQMVRGEARMPGAVAALVD